MANTEGLVPLLVRMPRPTRQWIEEKAEREGRSLSQMASRLLEQTREQDSEKTATT